MPSTIVRIFNDVSCPALLATRWAEGELAITVAYFFDMPQVDTTTASQVSGYIREALGSTQPEGSLFHGEGPIATGGWWTSNV